ncbi:hypothetical protein FCIRC_5619 [Fusarium circinatum]|uniref:Apple domain-containing protein n=1 Tax=Fusarium circinatum TaxID=48490 RepID=A0A8H5WZA1_FUSCI|nr:hypothetical protein FCIRC_5619 [Fusarium circinatum]
MKIFMFSMSLALMGAANAQEACEEGKRVNISPSYTVEYRCNKYRIGQTHENVLRYEDCAAMCEATGLDVCTYHADRKICIVGDPNGREGSFAGYTYMIRVQNDDVDPFPDEEDPFPPTCEQQRDNFKAKLDKCQADLEAASKKPSCGVDKWGQGYYDTKTGMNIANCKAACNADGKCLSYSANRGNTGPINCYLYSKETADVPDRKYENFVQYDKRCP